MTEDAIKIKLPVGEELKIRKNRFSPAECNEKTKRFSVVSGIHGDEVEGQYVCYLLAKWLNEHQSNIKGIIDIYPALNPIGLDSIKRGFPFFNIDLNRIFPGSKNDYLPSQVANLIVEEIKGSDYAIDIHASNIFLKELPQVRINKSFASELVPLAMELKIDFIWVHDSVTVLESTFSHTLNSLGTKTLVVEMGVGMRLTKEYCESFLEGLLNLMAFVGVIDIPVKQLKSTPISTENGEVFYLNASKSGLFVPKLKHCEFVEHGDIVGEVVDVLNGTILEIVAAPCDGLIFTIREYPIVYEGSLLARIFKEGKDA